MLSILELSVTQERSAGTSPGLFVVSDTPEPEAGEEKEITVKGFSLAPISLLLTLKSCLYPSPLCSGFGSFGFCSWGGGGRGGKRKITLELSGLSSRKKK